MKIHCDGCAKEISKETSIVVEVGGEIYHFCTPECEASRRITEPILLEEEDDRKTGSQDRE